MKPVGRAAVAALVGAVVVGTGSVAGAAPAATAKITVARKGTATTLKLAVKVPAHDRVAHFSLKFGDGSKTAGGAKVPGTVTHRYRAGHRYTATLTVTTAKHRTITSHVTVAGPAAAGSATAGSLTPTIPTAPTAAAPTFADQWQDSGDPGIGRNEVQAADLDGDGNDDLIGLDDNDGVTVALGDGHGHFHAAPASAPITASAIAVADVTGDGVPDLVTESEQPAYPGVDPVLHVYAGDGTGGFAATSSLALPWQKYDNYTLSIADLGGAGPTIIADGALYPTDGRGALSPAAQTLPNEVSTVVPVSGGQDALVTVDPSDSNDHLLVYRGDGTGGVRAPDVIRLGFGPGDWYGGGWSQLGNGRLAIPIVNSTMNGPAPTFRLAIVDISADALASDAPLPSGLHEAGDTTGNTVLDFNHDGIPDLITAFGEVLLGHSDGTFTLDGRIGSHEWGDTTAPTWDFGTTLVATNQVVVMLHGFDVHAFAR